MTGTPVMSENAMAELATKTALRLRLVFDICMRYELSAQLTFLLSCVYLLLRLSPVFWFIFLVIWLRLRFLIGRWYDEATMITIRPYKKSDYDTLVIMMSDFQDYLVPLDPLKLSRRAAGYGVAYMEKTLNEVRTQRGRFYVAQDSKGTIVGLAVGIIPRPRPIQRFESAPGATGIVTELYVVDALRGKGLGKKLLRTLEQYFKTKKCKRIRIAVFAPNVKALAFYHHCGYGDRDIEVLKVIK
jgi:GNAT superfamily N-acetyltransferase